MGQTLHPFFFPLPSPHPFNTHPPPSPIQHPSPHPTPSPHPFNTPPIADIELRLTLCIAHKHKYEHFHRQRTVTLLFILKNSLTAFLQVITLYHYPFVVNLRCSVGRVVAFLAAPRCERYDWLAAFFRLSSCQRKTIFFLPVQIFRVVAFSSGKRQAEILMQYFWGFEPVSLSLELTLDTQFKH